MKIELELVNIQMRSASPAQLIVWRKTSQFIRDQVIENIEDETWDAISVFPFLYPSCMMFSE